MSARERLVAELREHALVIGEVTLDRGRDGAVLRRRQARDPAPAGLRRARRAGRGTRASGGATAVGGLTMGADPLACAALAGGADVKAFFVRKETKAHGLQRRVEGPPLDAGERCLSSRTSSPPAARRVQAIEARAGRGPRDRRRRGRPRPARRRRRRDRGGRPATRPTTPLATIDDVYPDRPGSRLTTAPPRAVRSPYPYWGSRSRPGVSSRGSGGDGRSPCRLRSPRPPPRPREPRETVQFLRPRLREPPIE